MATDISSELIKNAYLAAGGGTKPIDYTEGVDKIQKSFNKLGKGIGTLAAQEHKRQQVEEQKKERKAINDFNKKAKDYQDKISTLPESEQNALIEHLEQQAIEYGESKDDPTSRSAIMTDLDQRTLQLENVNVFKDEMIKAIETDPDQGGLVDSFKLSDQALEFGGILSGETEMVYQDDKYGFLMHDPEKLIENENKIEEINNSLNELNDQYDSGNIYLPEEDYMNQVEEYNNEILDIQNDIESGSRSFMDIHDLRDIMKEQSFDKSINNTIKKLASDFQIMGREGGDFLYDDIVNTVSLNVVGEGGKRSLKYDSHIDAINEQGEKRTFETDLLEAIFRGPDGKGTKYEDLGLDSTTINALDPDQDGYISINDAISIANEILNNDELCDPYLANYFTSYFQKKWKVGNDEYSKQPKVYDPTVGIM